MGGVRMHPAGLHGLPDATCSSQSITTRAAKPRHAFPKELEQRPSHYCASRALVERGAVVDVGECQAAAPAPSYLRQRLTGPKFTVERCRFASGTPFFGRVIMKRLL